MRVTRRASPLILAALALLTSPQAEAVTFDFAAVAAGAEQGYPSFSMTVDGLTVIATASLPPPELPVAGPEPVMALNSSAGPYVYLDAPLGALPGGMGVCLHLDTSGQCDPNTDDGLSPGELLTLTFSSQVSIAQILFRNADHGTSFSGLFGLKIDGVAVPSPALSHIFTPLTEMSGTTFVFSVPFDSEDYYIQSLEVEPIPEPTTLLLLGSGLAGFGLARRRRRQSLRTKTTS